METLPRPNTREPELWVDEAIWGHRLHDEQTPWLMVLEFLGVFQAEAKLGRALSEEQYNSLSYLPQQQLKLRNLLFNNPHLMPVMQENHHDEERWRVWLHGMRLKGGKVSEEVCAMRCCDRDLEKVGAGEGAETQRKA